MKLQFSLFLHYLADDPFTNSMANNCPTTPDLDLAHLSMKKQPIMHLPRAKDGYFFAIYIAYIFKIVLYMP
jgi:hypothetical protein